jgi:feruloyl esterase
VALEQYPNNRRSYIPASMWQVIYEAVLDQCDALDGVVDGIIMDPSKCTFQPEVLLCGMPAANSSACLNTAQLNNLKRMYRPWLTDDGTLVNPGISHSGEAYFSVIMNEQVPEVSRVGGGPNGAKHLGVRGARTGGGGHQPSSCSCCLDLRDTS